MDNDSLTEVSRLEYYIYTKSIDKDYDVKQINNKVIWHNNHHIAAKMILNDDTEDTNRYKFYVNKKLLNSNNI